MIELYECSCGYQMTTSSGHPPEDCHRCGNSIPEYFTYIGEVND